VHHRHGAIVVIAAALSSVLVVPAAARAATLGDTATRRTVERIVHQSYPDLAFGNVACPTGVAKRRGTKFTCTVQLPGAFLVVDATQTDGRGTISVTSPQAVISQPKLQQFVAANASLPAAVDCGPGPWLAIRPGTKVTCSALLADGTSRHAEVTVNDTAGNVTITAVTP
jgi:hypothetical protein